MYHLFTSENHYSKHGLLRLRNIHAFCVIIWEIADKMTKRQNKYL